MKENQFNLNDIVYFIHGTNLIKGIIDEYYLHYTQEKVIIKYIIRPYGLADHVTIDEDKIYTNFEEPKKVIIRDLKETYTKDNIKRNYKEARKQMEKKYKKEVKDFDTNFKVAINAIEKTNDDLFNDMEDAYQKQEKESV